MNTKHMSNNNMHFQRFEEVWEGDYSVKNNDFKNERSRTN